MAADVNSHFSSGIHEHPLAIRPQIEILLVGHHDSSSPAPSWIGSTLMRNACFRWVYLLVGGLVATGWVAVAGCGSSSVLPTYQVEGKVVSGVLQDVARVKARIAEIRAGLDSTR